MTSLSSSPRPVRRSARAAVAVGLSVAAAVFFLPESASAATLPSQCTQSGSTVTCTYLASGGAQTLAIPAGSTGVRVTARGGAGGAGGAGASGAVGGAGGVGAVVVAAPADAPQGASLRIVPGAAGAAGVSGATGTAGAGAAGTGTGGSGGSGAVTGGGGGAGGSASAVYLGNAATPSLVGAGGAGGGGGAGTANTNRVGGAGGAAGANGMAGAGAAGATGGTVGTSGGATGVSGASAAALTRAGGPGGGGGGVKGGGAGGAAAQSGGGGGGGGTNLGSVSGTNAAAGSVTVVYTAAPAAAPATVRGDVQFGAGYRASLDVQGTATSGSGSCAISAGDFRAVCRSITSSTRNGGRATITGTVLVRSGAVVPFTAVVTDGSYPGGNGVDTLQFTADGQTYAGNVTRGNLTVS